jgi:hypothetical protein
MIHANGLSLLHIITYLASNIILDIIKIMVDSNNPFDLLKDEMVNDDVRTYIIFFRLKLK